VRVFVGLSEVANCVHTYAKGFRAIGIDTYTVVSRQAWAYPDSTYDVNLEELLGPPPSARGGVREILNWRRHLWRLRYYFVFLRALLTCDVFIFTFGSSFRADRSDYALLKRLGKKIVTVFLGSDVRYWFAYKQEAELLGTDADIRPYLESGVRGRSTDYLAVKLHTVRQAEAYADLILGVPDAGQIQVRPYMRANIPIDLSSVECHVPDREVPVIVHAPSVRSLKGTEYVLESIERLRAEGIAFEFRLIERAPNAEVRAALRDSDILVDQLFSETVATLALEGLATGNAVLARYLPKRVRIAADCPVINVNLETLTDRLREVILDRALRRRLAEAGRAYVERYHSHVVVARQILEWLDPARRGEFHFHPTFFREQFRMSRELAREEAELLEHEPLYVRVATDPTLAGVRFCEESAPSPSNAR
jgi:glycosyltransferase involved in cell wall biosynthesis